MAGNNGRSGIAPFEDPVAGIEEEAAFEFFSLFAVALVTILDENRADFLFEKLEFGGFRARKYDREAD